MSAFRRTLFFAGRSSWSSPEGYLSPVQRPSGPQLVWSILPEGLKRKCIRSGLPWCSAKVLRAHHQQALLGFRQGGSLTYGFRRLLVDASRNPRQILGSGETIALSSDKVVIVPGPPEELAVIRRIFKLYVQDRLSIAEITRRLSKKGIPGYGGKPLGHQAIRHILSCELCIGQMTYNVTTSELQSPTRKNPEELWARFPAFEPVVSGSQFRRAQERLAQSQVRWDKESIAASLRTLLSEKGRLTQIVEAESGPCYETVVNHFGSLDAAYAAVG